LNKTRLEAFSDGVIAILITIMVLELRVPEGADWEALQPIVPVFITYILSFVVVGIYWNNHHHLLHLAETVNGKVMWANLHFLFWLSLFPFVTSWLNEAQPVPSPVPTALYGFVLLMAGAAWIPLMRTLIACNGGQKSELKKAIRSDWKEWGSVLVYAVAIALSFFVPIVSCGLYAAVAAMWFVPDRRIEEKVNE